MRWVEMGHGPRATRLCSTADEEINDHLAALESVNIKVVFPFRSRTVAIVIDF
jgi:hypothetical protein